MNCPIGLMSHSLQRRGRFFFRSRRPKLGVKSRQSGAPKRTWATRAEALRKITEDEEMVRLFGYSVTLSLTFPLIDPPSVYMLLCSQMLINVTPQTNIL